MERNKEDSTKRAFEKEVKQFYESTLQYLSDNFITILLILFVIAMVTGLRNGCHAAHE